MLADGPLAVTSVPAVKPVLQLRESARRIAGATRTCTCSSTSTSLWTQANSSS